jgi:hypothetical protein
LRALGVKLTRRIGGGNAYEVLGQCNEILTLFVNARKEVVD